jgi:polysaccharide deacetylase family protein (PEP-CTERM system associated)
MKHDASSPLGKSAVVLAIVAIAAVILNLIFAQTLHFEALGLLSFGLFCLGYGFLLKLPRNTQDQNEALENSTFFTGPLLEGVRPTIVPNQQKRKIQPANAAVRLRHALTIDLEDYFHTEVASQGVSFEQWEHQPSRVEASTHQLLELLDRNHTHATFFVLGWVAKRYPRLIQDIHRRGHEIGCHSLNHQLVCRMNPGEFYESTRIAKNLIESIVREPILGYRAPCFSITPGCEWAFEVLAELGFAYDSSVHPVQHPVYGNPDAPRVAYSVGRDQLMEFPIATWKLGGRNLPVGGGAYLRLLPYQYIHRGLKAWERRMQAPAMFYLHPWEIDPFQPHIPLSFHSKVRQTWGTATMEDKLQRLLVQFRFAPVREVYKEILERKGQKRREATEFVHEESVEQVAG